ncbi:MAG: hypothetical protein RL059_38 [Bacteroidota bacterium]|jgi:glycosyltransferase involved in cell wall biosynthesis
MNSERKNTPFLSVIICTFNPDFEYLKRCLVALQNALDLIKTVDSEVILVDNNSSNYVLQNPKIIELLSILGAIRCNETKQGLTFARIRGINTAGGDYLVYLDDDNIVDLDYFQNGIEIIKNHPFVGAFSGTVNLEYDNPISAQETLKYHGLLVKRNLTKDLWSNIYFNNETMPCGAGLWIKNDVARQYIINLANRNQNISFDRVGKEDLSSGGDNDLAMTAIDVGYGTGLFHNLIITHLIPENRTSLEYLLKLTEGIEYSSTMLKYVRLGNFNNRSYRVKLAGLIRLIFSDNISRRFQVASFRGSKRAEKKIKSMGVK